MWQCDLSSEKSLIIDTGITVSGTDIYCKFQRIKDETGNVTRYSAHSFS